MKRTTLVLSACLLLLASCSRQYTCDDFKTGTYTMADKGYENITITRTETQQIEESTAPDNRYKDVYKIMWDGTCSYDLVFESTDNISRMPFSKYDTISVRIVEILDDGYIFETAVFDKRPSGRFIKVD